MSKVSRLSKPAFSAIHRAPVTPPAGPLISMLTGACLAASTLISPPSERSTCSLAPTLRSPSSPSRLPR